MILILTIFFGCILVLSIVNVTSGDISDAPEELLEGCKEIAKTIWNTKETESQTKVKEFIIENSTRLLNGLFVVIVGLALWSGFVSVYKQYRHTVLSFVEEYVSWSHAYTVIILVISILFAILIYLQVLLVLFKFVRAIDLFKLYIFVELTAFFIGYYRADQDNKDLLVVEMLKKVTDINIDLDEAKRNFSQTSKGDNKSEVHPRSAVIEGVMIGAKLYNVKGVNNIGAHTVDTTNLKVKNKER